MKRYLKIILFIVIFLIISIVLDTLQASIFKSSPSISWKENFVDNDSWVDRGILIDTYYCTKEKDIVTVSTKLKTSKFTCYNDNVTELNEIENVSMIIKDGTLTKTSATIIITDLSGENNIYGTEFRIDKKDNGQWKEIETITENYAWNLIGYSVDENNKLELEQNWEWLYGKLESGEYRLIKFISTLSDEENYYFSVEFNIN